jgi:hypothetical protein
MMPSELSNVKCETALTVVHSAPNTINETPNISIQKVVDASSALCVKTTEGDSDPTFPYTFDAEDSATLCGGSNIRAPTGLPG